MKKYILYAALCVIAILIITNPSINDFKAFSGSNTYEGLHRESNWFVFSQYSNANKSGKYTGVLGNFFFVAPPIVADSLYHTLTSDGYDVGTIQQFKVKLKDRNKLAALYKVLKEKYPYYRDVSLDDFRKRLTVN